MRMNYIELKGFKRFALNNINYFKYSPHERHQLILGTNGSGKSSLLGEMSPLPADPRNYTKDGYKKIEIERDVSNITLFLNKRYVSRTLHI